MYRRRTSSMLKPGGRSSRGRTAGRSASLNPYARISHSTVCLSFLPSARFSSEDDRQNSSARAKTAFHLWTSIGGMVGFGGIGGDGGPGDATEITDCGFGFGLRASSMLSTTYTKRT